MGLFWQVDLRSTQAAAAELVAEPPATSPVSAWLESYDSNAAVSSNVGSSDIAFQRWLKFKEAFSPKFVIDAISSIDRTPTSCLDPFGGSGTTALTCALLGIKATTIEVNPFLADLIRAKVTPINSQALLVAYERVMRRARAQRATSPDVPHPGPLSLREPGIDGRFVFSAGVFDRVQQLRRSISKVSQPDIRRLLLVLLGSILVSVSNVVVNGKGRRYRGGWTTRTVSTQHVDDFFAAAVRLAAHDFAEFGHAIRATPSIICGDARQLLARRVAPVDVAIFSPPYPNSFDYTDVYNLELWMLGYLRSSHNNLALRKQTLRSHVQVGWTASRSQLTRGQPQSLKSTLARLERSRAELWNPRLVSMVAHYFDDLTVVLRQLRRRVRSGGTAIAVVGDSCYAGVSVDTATILGDIAESEGFRILQQARIRSMRRSAQHGGTHRLSEDCLVLTNP